MSDKWPLVFKVGSIRNYVTPPEYEVNVAIHSCFSAAAVRHRFNSEVAGDGYHIYLLFSPFFDDSDVVHYPLNMPSRLQKALRQLETAKRTATGGGHGGCDGDEGRRDADGTLMRPM